MELSKNGKFYKVSVSYVDKHNELKALFKRYIENIEEGEGYDFIDTMPEEDQIALKKIKEGK